MRLHMVNWACLFGFRKGAFSGYRPYGEPKKRKERRYEAAPN